MLFLANKNQFLVKHGIFLELVRWEFLSSSFSETRKQDDFNKVLEESEIFTCLIFDRIGQYTREEFDIAYQNYKQGKNPRKFYLYFKTIPKGKQEEAFEVYEFRHAMEKDEQIYREYKNPDQLKLFLNQNLDEDLPEILKAALLQNIYDLNELSMTKDISKSMLDSLEEADKMLSKNLTEEALEVYQKALHEINKEEHPDLFCKIKMQIIKCFINLSAFENEEKYLQRAILLIEEIKKIISLESNLPLYIECENQLSYIYFRLASIRNQQENIEKAIQIGERALSHVKSNQEPLLFINLCNNVGGAYVMKFYQAPNPQNFQQALFYLQSALDLMDASQDSDQYYSSIIEISTLYLYHQRLLQEKDERIAMIHKGLSYPLKELERVTMEKNPDVYNKLHNTLSGGYSYLGELTKDLAYFEKSVESSKKALFAFSGKNKTVDYLIVALNMSGNYYSMYTQTKELLYIDKTIQLLEEIQSSMLAQAFPIPFAMMLNHLGRSYYLKASPSDEKKDQSYNYLTRAIEYLEQAVIVNSNQDSSNFSSSKLWLAKAFYQLSQLENKKKNLQYALDAVLASIVFLSKSPATKTPYEAALSLKETLEQALTQ